MMLSWKDYTDFEHAFMLTGFFYTDNQGRWDVQLHLVFLTCCEKNLPLCCEVEIVVLLAGDESCNCDLSDSM